MVELRIKCWLLLGLKVINRLCYKWWLVVLGFRVPCGVMCAIVISFV